MEHFTPEPTGERCSVPERDAAPFKHWTEQYFSPMYNRVYSGPLLSEANTELEIEFLESVFTELLPAPIVDVGCAFGRHVKELKARKWPVVGLDRFRHLLTEHPKRGRRLVNGDMRLLPFLPGSIGGFFCLFNSFGYYPHEDNMATLHEWGKALMPGGRLVLHVPNRPVMAQIARDFAPSQMITHDFVLIETYGYEAEEKTMVGSGVWQFPNAAQPWSFRLRLYTRTEMERAFKKEGLKMVELFEDFEGTEFDDKDSTHMVIVAEKQA
ncbi:MAG: class I SAM-dependent methyltransferase [Candidatus Sumerlaeia bacterium]|nr:class I SAM-dependent methyltransferase [Candidatus Sumerlaeia bacterium]